MVSTERQLKALANKRRLAIIKFLDKAQEASVSDISEQIRLSFKSTSKHLAILTAAEFVDKDQRSREVFYKLAQPKSVIIKHVLTMV